MELLWIIHTLMFETLKKNHPSTVREYLLSAGDMVLLGRWDSGSFKETEGGVTYA